MCQTVVNTRDRCLLLEYFNNVHIFQVVWMQILKIKRQHFLPKKALRRDPLMQREETTFFEFIFSYKVFQIQEFSWQNAKPTLFSRLHLQNVMKSNIFLFVAPSVGKQFTPRFTSQNV